MPTPDRTYGQYCPIAAGLDVVGDRWTLLICRELAQGDRRYTDLRNALDGIAPNLLSDRLRTLQEAGLVTTCELPPPVARCVYRLTDDGRRIIPVLRAMARFGVAYLEGVPLEVGDSQIDIALDGLETHLEPAEGDADIVIKTESASLVRARQGEPLDA